MKNISEHIENAFDLSFLETGKVPETDIKTIGVLGGGTAGYLTALALQKQHPQIKVTVIESSKIPVIGVGESTTSEILPFLHRILEIDPVEFFAEVEPTLKLGIHFDWGNPGDYKFNFSFFAGHQYESYYYENSIANSNWPSVLMNAKKMPVLRQDDGSLLSFLPSIPFSYHLDNKKLILFLHKQIKARKIPLLDAEIETVNLDENGFVSSVQSKEGTEHKFDLYIDCSGFRSKILGQALKTEFIPFTSTLVTNRALTFNTANNGVITPYTTVTTMPSGWCWTIPMRGENHHGYVHSSLYSDEKTALAEASARFGEIKDYKMVEFRSGRHAVAYNKNVYALGNAYAFIEPLESTAIQTVVHSIMLLCRLMPKSHGDVETIAGLNKEVSVMWDTFRWFLGLHYRFNNKLDTPFWKWSRANTEIGNAARILGLFNERPPLSAGNFGTNSPYSATEALVFNSYSYDTLIFGQKLVAKKLAPPKMSKAEYDSKLASYQALTERAVTQAELFQDEGFPELLYDLFNDADTWIAETDV